MLEVMPPLACRKALGLRNDFRLLLHRSGRKLALVCVTIPEHPTLPPAQRGCPGCSAKGRGAGVSEGCVLSFTLPSALSEI